MGKMISISEVSELTGVTVKTLKIWDNEEMVNDLISVVTCFSARLYGSCGGRKIKTDIEKSIKELEKERGENSENNNESDSN